MTDKKEDKPKRAVKPSEPTFTPAEYREKFCMEEVKGPDGSGKMVSVGYQVAATLYKWADQAHHYGEDSFKLTQVEFEKAIFCALAFPCEAPFPAAVPPIIKDKFKNFKPKKG